MSRARSLAVLLVCLLLPSLPAPGQTSQEPESQVEAAELRQLRKATAENTSLDEDARASALEYYDVALKALEAAAGFSRQAGSSNREQAGIGRVTRELQAELERPVAEPRLDLPSTTTRKQAEVALARERARLSAHRSSLRALEDLTEERANARNEASRRLGLLDQQMEVLSDDLRELNQRDTHPDVKEAARYRNRALRESALREKEALRARLDLLDAQGGLLPSRIDQAQRRVDQSQGLVDLLENATAELRRQETLASLERVRRRATEATELSPELAALATETLALAEELWGESGVLRAQEKASHQIAATRRHQLDLDRIVQLTRRQFEAYGRRGSISRWWPQIPEDFPAPGDIAKTVGQLERAKPKVQHELIQLEQLRAGARTRGELTLNALSSPEDGSSPDPEVLRAATELLNTRRDLLDELIRLDARYSNLLVELETLSRIFLADAEDVEAFLFEHLLWVRSVPRPIIPRPGNILDGLLWFLSWENWQEVGNAIYRNIRARPVAWLLLLAAYAFLVAIRPRLRTRMGELPTAVAEGNLEPFPATLRAVAYSLLRAAPLPLGLFLASRALVQAEVTTFAFAADEAFYYTAWVAALLELTRVALGPGGLAGGHFSWPERITSPVQRNLVRTEFIVLPLLFVAMLLARAGMRLESPASLQMHNNSLGRTAFILGLTTLGLSLLAAFRPRRKPDRSTDENVSEHHRSLYYYAIPPVLLATLIPAILAAFGYYVTGYLLAYQMLRTVGLAVACLLLAGLLFRWRDSQREKSAALEAETSPPTVAEIQAQESQVHGLFRFVVILVAAIGLYGIWSGAVPTLRILERIQIWPTIALLEEGNEDLASADPAPPSAPESTEAVPLPPGLPSTGAAPAAQPDPSRPLTLWSLLRALLGLVVTFMLSKNLPGLIDLVLRRRSRLDAGGRIAVTTLVRYTILMLGLSLSFGMLGLSWSKIQWLAAALTFGLGFGLQEIVANFVSGLILLLERPVRVGDAVTVGNLQGRVSRIQIRATTITLWDRSEMIVPNKEFITTKLVNWTLSDSKRRLDIPLRIAYGADLVLVKKTLLEVARGNPMVLEDPPPSALVLDFGDDAIRVELRVFVDFGQGLESRDQLSLAIDHAFQSQGIAFALPQLTLQIPHRERTATSRPTPPPEPAT